MLSHLECVSAPTLDTPGTLFILHFDDKRYLIGNASEGTSRACTQHGVALKKVDDILLTGSSKWSQFGGMLGMMLGLADVKKTATAAQKEMHSGKKASKQKTHAHQNRKADEMLSLRLHGAPNLNYTVATARRFIFRTGIPIKIVEYAKEQEQVVNQPIQPTWADDYISTWAMPLVPRGAHEAAPHPQRASCGGRKRSFDEMTDTDEDSLKYGSRNAEQIVQQMFNSDWGMDKLFEQPLKNVKLPATVFIRDPSNGKYVKYTGPMPGTAEFVPDINVFVRKPWPGAECQILRPTMPKPESISYIIRNHPSRGRFLPQRAQALKVEPRSLYAQLTAGRTVKNLDGEDITPDMVMEASQQGSGFLIADIPTVDYLEDLQQRPELSDASVMEGIKAFVWILGPGVLHDSRLAEFQAKYTHVDHVIASPDLQNGGLTLSAAARSLRTNHEVDSSAFPLLQENDKLAEDRSKLDTPFTAADRGLRIVLAPKYELRTTGQTPPEPAESVEDNYKADFDDTCHQLLESAGPIQAVGPQFPANDAFKDIQVWTLGTGSSHPSLLRNVSGTLVRIPGVGSYLFDAGEGTLNTLQRMLPRDELLDVLRDLRMVWISHMHADHHLGLTSIIRAWYEANHGSVPGPEINASNFDRIDSPVLGVVSDAPMLHWLYEYSAVEDFGYSRILPLATKPTPGKMDRGSPRTKLCFARDGISADAAAAEDLTARLTAKLGLASLSSVFVNHCSGAQAVSIEARNGFKASYSGDCRPSAEFAHIGRDSDLLIHEATFEDEMRNEALGKKHSTAGEALVVAHHMRARAVVLTHFSQRYPKMPALGAPKGAPAAVLETKDAGDDANDTPPAATDELGPAAAPALPERRESRSRSTSTSSSSSSMSRSPPRERRASFRATNMGASYGQLVQRRGVDALLAQSEMRVVMAFDYMRLRLRDLARLEAKQPCMRALYDRLSSIKNGEAVEGDH